MRGKATTISSHPYLGVHSAKKKQAKIVSSAAIPLGVANNNPCTTFRVVSNLVSKPPDEKITMEDLISGASASSKILCEGIEHLKVSSRGHRGSGEEFYSVIFDLSARGILTRWFVVSPLLCSAPGSSWEQLDPTSLHEFIRAHWQTYYAASGVGKQQGLPSM